MSFARKYMKLEVTTVNEISQTTKHKYHDCSHFGGSEILHRHIKQCMYI